ncbi:unnamed protein product [Staurois parvus]|uniref:Uncharacterized protein n=1 Tax=Staurois parvus TaxID=386267 RepID=A0ABN9AKQ8_9NEOB|nr:unnamed protein product [Staurois parvus]
MSRASPNPPSNVWPAEEESSASPDSSMRRPSECSKSSWRMSSAMPSPTMSMPRGRPSPPWTLSMLSNDRDTLCMILEGKPRQLPPRFIVIK